jgi:energy-coupling factor transport system ATP-binding protein
MEFAAEHFGRIVVMRQGEIVADGPPSRIFVTDATDLLASTGLQPPPAAQVGAALGLTQTTVTLASLVAALAERP